MAITVKFFANFREAIGKDQETVEGVEDIASLFEELVRKFGKKLAHHLYSPGSKEPRETVNVLVNGRFVDLSKGLKTALKDGDLVAIFPPVSGGSPKSLSRRR